MKKLFIYIYVCLLAFPLLVLAESTNYESLNLDEALTQENIEHDFSNYKENDKQAVIYLFRGNGCGYCRNFLTFLNSIVDEYGDYFRVVSYEVWYNSNNEALAQDVADFMGVRLDGVPFIVIGDKVFPGFNNSYEEEVKTAIMDQYNSKDKYDVLEAMEKARKKEEKEQNKGNVNYYVIIICDLLFIVSATSIVIYFINNKHNELLDKIEKLEEKLDSSRYN